MVDANTLAEVAVEVSANLAPLERDFAKAKQQAVAHNKDMQRLTAGQWAAVHQQKLGKVTDERVAASRRAAEASRRLEQQYLSEARANQRLTDQIARHSDAMRNELLLTNRLATRRAAGGGPGGRGPIGPTIVPIVPPLRDTERGIRGVGQAASTATLFMRGFIGAIGIHTATQLAGLVTETLRTTAAIKDVARQTGLTTSELQEFRGIASQVGLSAAEMDQGFVQFHDTLGKVATSATRESKLFKLLGISLKDAGGNAKTTEQVFGEFVAKMGEVGSEAQRTAALALVYGETLGPKMAQFIGQGQGKINEFREAIRALGLVMGEDEIQKADETWRKFEQLKLVLSTQTASAVVANADAILTLANALASVIGVAVKAAGALATFFSVASQPMPELGGRSGMGFGFGLLTNPAGAIGKLGFDLGTGKAGARQSRPSASVMLPPAGKSTGQGGGIDLSSLFAPKGRKGGRGRQAPENIFEREELQAAQERLRLLRSSTADLVRRNEIDRELIDLKMRERFVQIDRDVKEGRLTAAQGRQLKLQEEANAQLEREAADREMRADQVEKLARTADELSRAEEQMLDVSLRLARTEDQRAKIEASLLQIKQQEEIRDIDRQIALAQIAQDEQRIAELTELRRKALERQAGETKAFAKEHLRGIEKFRDELPMTVDEINEQIENIRFELFTEKLQEAARFAEDVGDAFGRAAGRIANFENPLSVLQGLLQDLSATLTEQFIVGPVSDWATKNIGGPLAKKTIGKELTGPDTLTVEQMNMALDLATANLHSLSTAAAAASASMGGGGVAGASEAADALTQSASATAQGFQSLTPQLGQFGNGLMQILSGLAGGGAGGGLGGLLQMGLSIAGSALGGGMGGAGAAAGGTNWLTTAIPSFSVPALGGYADGGWIGGWGTGKSDSMTVRASIGEHMTNARAAKAFAPLLDGINSGRIPSMPALKQMLGGQQIDARRFSFGGFSFPGIRDAREARQAERHMISTLQRELGRASKAGYRQQP